MFKILQNDSASVAELTQGYREIQAQKDGFLASIGDLKAELSALHLAGGKKADALRKVRDSIQEAKEKVDACDTALQEIKRRIQDAFVPETKEQMAQVTAAIQALQAEKSQLIDEMLSTLAGLFVQREAILGSRFATDDRLWLTGPGWLLRHGDTVRLQNMIKERRVGLVDVADTLARRLRDARRELHKLNTSREAGPDSIFG